MDAAAEVCQRCGFKMVAPPQDGAQVKKNPNIAAVASILPGLGEIYTEQTRKGIVLVIVSVFMLYLSVTNNNIVAELAETLYVVLFLYGAYDSYNMAKMINAELT